MSQALPNSAQPQLRRELGLRDLILFNISAVVGVRWLAAAAHIGPGAITLWLLAAVLFFVPSALAVSGLAAKYPEQGGLYAWTKRELGEWNGFVCGWLYWCSNLFYFPNLLLAAVSMAAYTAGPRHAALADDHAVVLAVSILVLWVSVLTNLVGVRVGKWTENIGGACTYLVGILLVTFGAILYFTRGSVTPFAVQPEWDWEKLNLWSQIAFAFGGLELGAVMGGEIRNPKRTVPRATWISGLGIAAIYITGTLAILVMLVPEDVNIISGLAQAGAVAGAEFGMPWIPILLAGLITFGITGQLGAWISGTARIPAVIGIDRYLPEALGRVHPKWGTPYVAILVQGVACTVFLVIMQIGENLRSGYQLLVDMTVITYFIPFCYLFITSSRNGNRVSGTIGLLVTVLAIILSLLPPAEIASVWLFEAKLIGGTAILIAVARVLYLRSRRRALMEAAE
jgi:glutamate:GABA antiporter